MLWGGGVGAHFPNFIFQQVGLKLGWILKFSFIACLQVPFLVELSLLWLWRGESKVKVWQLCLAMLNLYCFIFSQKNSKLILHSLNKENDNITFLKCMALPDELVKIPTNIKYTCKNSKFMHIVGSWFQRTNSENISQIITKRVFYCWVYNPIMYCWCSSIILDDTQAYFIIHWQVLYDLYK